MKTTKSLTALVLVLFAALLGSSCQPRPRSIGPKTVLGPVSCEEKTRNTCGTCIRASCCAELTACANSPPCPCWMGHFQASAEEALKVCGPAPANFEPLKSCFDAHCAEACKVDAPVSRHPLLDKPAPEIVAEPLGGDGPKTLEAARGKVVIVEFWETSCGACKRTFPKYQEIVDRHPRDVAVLGVAVDDPENTTKERVLAVARDHGARFSIVWDTRLLMETRYTMPNGYPTTFVVDRGGTVRRVIAGYSAEIDDAVKALLTDPNPSPPRDHGGSPP